MQCYSCKQSRSRSKRPKRNEALTDSDSDNQDDTKTTRTSLRKRLRRLLRHWFANLSIEGDESKKLNEKMNEYIKFRLTEHKSSVITSAILTNGTIITGSLQGQIVYHLLKHGQSESCTYLTGQKSLGRELGAVRSLLALSNSEFASGSSNGSIIIWNSKWSEGVKCRLDGSHKDPVWSMALLSERYMASGSYGEIKIWDLGKWPSKIVTTHSIKDCPYIALSLAALSSEDLASGYNDGSIILWHISMNILFTSHKVKTKLIVSGCFISKELKNEIYNILH